MPRALPLMKTHISIKDEQRRSHKAHVTPAMAPKLPSSLDARKRLVKNLKYMGLGPFFMNFLWTITNPAMADKLMQHCPIPEEVQHIEQRGVVHHITKSTVAQI
jgi:hypothetical protein